ncbi:MAG: PD-(D/E)XK nuclease family protein [Actinomycetia bacterium]|nr:PD-(D/E)XK nuclease family protein [Actinomycetes bacterium]
MMVSVPTAFSDRLNPAEPSPTSKLPLEPGEATAPSPEAGEPLGNLSPSRASDFKTCPRLYKFRHIQKIPSVPTPAQARGTAIHLALERLFDLPATDRHPDQLLALLEGAWEETLDSDEYQELFAGDSDGQDKYLRASRKVAERYFQVEDPREIEPVEREKLITLLIADDSKRDDRGPLEVRGIIDRLDSGPDGGLVITDYKTGKAPPLRFADSSFFALKVYALMVGEEAGRTPAYIRLLYLGNSEAYSLAVSEGQLRGVKRQLLALRRAIDRAITTDVFPPRKSRLCDWCSYQPICPAWADPPATGQSPTDSK